MKMSTISIVLAAALLSMTAVQASEFSGGFLGAKVGSNRSDVAGAGTVALPTYSAVSANTYGFEGGYNWDMGTNFLVGLSAFADFNQKKVHATAPAAVNTGNYGSDVYGLDVKLGLPSGNWLPYAKLGYGSARATGGVLTGTYAGAHLGLGVEYKFASHWSLAGEYTTTSGKNNGLKLNNNNLTIGVNYYFDSPYVAPAVVAAAAPVVMKAEPAPVEAPAPVAVSETTKTLLSDKPVSLEGTNFDFNSAKLRPAADKKLSEVAEFAGQYKDAKLNVTGYTDSIGTDAYNQKLSERRAASVKAELVKKGVAADRIAAEGKGEANPVADNKTKAGRALNRRVEIRSVIKVEEQVRVIR